MAIQAQEESAMMQKEQIDILLRTKDTKIDELTKQVKELQQKLKLYHNETGRQDKEKL